MISKYFGRFLFTKWAAFAHDFLCIPVALYLAFWLRFNLGPIPSQHMPGLLKMLEISMPIQVGMYWFFGFYRGLWRFASLPDIVRIIKAVLLGTLLSALVAVVFLQVAQIPRSIFVLYPVLLGLLLSGSRFLYRYSRDRHLYMKIKAGNRALIFGAGRAGESLIRDIISSQKYRPVGFLDDDPKRYGREIHGVRVLGRLTDLEPLARRLSVTVVLVAIPSANRETINRIVSECTRLGLECKTLPSVVELTGQKIEVGHLRAITVNDLLGREPVHLDERAIAKYLQGKSVLVTGGGGSIGSELCRQIAQSQPKRLIIFEHGEYNLYSIEHELRGSFPDLDLIAVLGDVKIANRVEWAFKAFEPEVVFHAAAYKHVPMLEKNPAEGVFNNVIGTKVVADAADKFGVQRFVLVSTDKAVNPANVMGATKRIAELYCQNLANRSNTKFITTRFGNVLGSAGSVVPLFEKQIKAGGPVTVTHKDITRYFMTIPEAVGLILQAGSMGKGSEIYVLEMGEPILIKDLAEQMIRLSGRTVGEDIQIEYTGLRPGEKLYEEIFHDSEGLMGTEHPKLQLARSREVDWEWLLHQLDELKTSAQSRDVALLLKHIRNIVPEFKGGSRRDEHKVENPAVRLRVVAGGGGR